MTTRQPREDIASYSNRNSIKKRPQEEARQPGEGIASYFNRVSIRNERRRRQGSQQRILHHI
jgi:hypothetical protein